MRRKSVMVRWSAIALLSCLFLQGATVSYGSGNWMGDWITSSTAGGPSYFEGQSRGYLSGGSFSARWPVSTNNSLISASPPKISAGCGGIDFYGGSVSFLKPDLLVKKLQNVLQNSAGVAFQMALTTLCPTCVQIMNSMEDISNKLNSMSMDDCKAAKGLVLAGRDTAMNLAEGFKEGQFASAMNLSMADSYVDMKNAVPAIATGAAAASDIQQWWNGNKGLSPTTDSTVSGCPANVQKFFPTDTSQPPVSVLDVIGKDMTMPQAYIDLLRGLVGDIKTTSVAAGGTGIEYIKPCPNNAKVDLVAIQQGNAEAMPSSMDIKACAKATGNDTSLETYVTGEMTTIMDALTHQNALLPKEVTFITGMPVPILYGIRTAIATGQQGSLLPQLASVAASGMAMNAIKDLLARYEAIEAYMHGVNSALTNGSDTCQLGKLSTVGKDSLNEMRQTVTHVYGELAEGYKARLQEVVTSSALNNTLLALNEQLKSNIAKAFGPSVAQRAMRSM